MNASLLVVLLVGIACVIAALNGGNVKIGDIEFKGLKSLKIRLSFGLMGVALGILWVYLALMRPGGEPQIDSKAGASSPPQTPVIVVTVPLGRTPATSDSNPLNAKAPPESPVPSGQPQSPKLPAEEVQRAIIQALDAGRLKDAENLLSNLAPGAVRNEECQHEYEFTLTNAKLADAVDVVNLCWNGTERQDRLNEIQHETLKHSEGEGR